MASLTLRDNGGRVGLRVGETLTVSLPETASTGYRWAVEHYDARRLSLEPAEAAYPVGEIVGAGGTALFTFTARKPGTARLRLRHARAWEREAIERFKVELVIAPV